MPSMYAENLTFERVGALGWKGYQSWGKYSIIPAGGWGKVYFDNAYIENGFTNDTNRLSSEKLGRFITIGTKTQMQYQCYGTSITYQNSTSEFEDYDTAILAIGTSGNRTFWYANRYISGVDTVFGLMASNDSASQNIILTKPTSSSGADEYTIAYPCKFLLRFDGGETGLVEQSNGTYKLVAK